MAIIPFSLSEQLQAIVYACKREGVPLQVFMGMYANETALGSDVTDSTSSPPAMGPFQFTGSDKGTGYLYPMTNTPSLSEFQAQATAAAAYLAELNSELGSWRMALAGYNAGPANPGAGLGYADQALAFQIPADWASALEAAGASPIQPVTGGGGGGQAPPIDTSGPLPPVSDYDPSPLIRNMFWQLGVHGQRAYDNADWLLGFVEGVTYCTIDGPQ